MSTGFSAFFGPTGPGIRHLKSLFAKLRVQDRTKAASSAICHGITASCNWNKPLLCCPILAYFDRECSNDNRIGSGPAGLRDNGEIPADLDRGVRRLPRLGTPGDSALGTERKNAGPVSRCA